MNIPQILISLFVVLFAITVHEASHGLAAFKLGDPTAHLMGRITLNPVAHIDPIGTVLFPIMLIIIGAPPFGWAKPVPVNPLNLKNPKKDNLIISAAGPASNFTVAFIAFIIIQILQSVNPGITRGQFGMTSPLTGLFLILYYTILINVILAMFNLIPIPPLDGSGILSGLLSDESAQKFDQIRPYGFFILIILMFTGVIGRILNIVSDIVYRLVFRF